MHSILISGAAQGIGAAIAQLFYQQGYRVGIYDIHLAQAQQLAEQLGERAHAGLLDVADYASWQAALSDFCQWAGELNILVNNAGISTQVHLKTHPIEAHHRTMAVNVNGVLNGCHAALPYLKQASFARVINLSSASAIYGQADLISYSASKFAVRGITEGLDIEWQKYGIRVLDVMPLFVQTAMVKDMDAATIQNMGVHYQQKMSPRWCISKRRLKIRFLTNTHRAVGLKAKTLMQLSSISPQWLNRLSNSLLAKRH